MRERDRKVIKGLMQVISRMDQCDETILFSAVGEVVPGLLISELQSALAYCQTQRWVNAVKGIFENNKWSPTDLGRAAVLEM